MKSKELRVALGIPSMGMWHEPFALSLIGVITAFSGYKVKGYDKQAVQLVSTKGSILPKSRWHIVKQAREMKATHLLFVDTDHTFPKHTLHALLMDEKDVVACNMVTKSLPALPTARMAPREGTDDPGYGLPVYSNRTDVPKLEKVWRVGTGMMLLRMEVLDRIAPSMFEILYQAEVDDYQGEDWTMATLLHNAGVDIWIDHEISLQCGHIGTFEYNHELAFDPATAEAPRIVLPEGV